MAMIRAEVTCSLTPTCPSAAATCFPRREFSDTT
jgi:hypothetical protein